MNGARIAWIGCSDGRANPYEATGLPLGTIETHFAIGANLNLGWHNFKVPVDHWYNYSVNKEGRTCLVLCSYHFCADHPKLGCAGHDNNTDAAMACAQQLCDQFERCFDQEFLQPLVIGLETGTRTFRVHTPAGEVIDLLDLHANDLPSLESLVKARFVTMKTPAATCLAGILKRNLEISLVSRQEHHSHEKAGHHEVAVMLGRDTDWAMTNKVLKINPYSPDMVAPLRDAAKILWHTFRDKNPDKKMPDEPFVLMTTGVYYDAGSYEELLAKEEAITLARLAHNVMTTKVEEMADCLEVIPGTVNHDNRSFLPIEDFVV